MSIKDQIRKALTGLSTGITTREIRERAKIDNPQTCALGIYAMKKSGELVAHPGETRSTTRYTLNPEHIETPKGGGRTRAKPKHAKKAKRKKARRGAAGRAAAAIARRARPTPAVVTPPFIAALAVGHRLVTLRDGVPLQYSAEETEAIAQLCAAHFG